MTTDSTPPSNPAPERLLPQRRWLWLAALPLGLLACYGLWVTLALLREEHSDTVAQAAALVGLNPLEVVPDPNYHVSLHIVVRQHKAGAEPDVLTEFGRVLTMDGRTASLGFMGKPSDGSETAGYFAIEITPRILADGSIRLQTVTDCGLASPTLGAEHTTIGTRHDDTVTVRPGDVAKFVFQTGNVPTWAEVTPRAATVP